MNGDNNYWKGLIDAKIEFNDKEHAKLYEAMKEFYDANDRDHREIDRELLGLKVKSSLYGMLSGIFGFLIMWVAQRFSK